MRLPIIIIILVLFSCQSQDQNEHTGKTGKDSSFKTTGDSLIRGERIDGPAHIRDTVNGKILFSLNDNAVVSATHATNKWLQVGVFIDISREELKNGIKKGKKLYSDGKVVGETKTDMKISGFETNEGIKGELVGYTSASNIRPNSIPENVLTAILNKNKRPLTLGQFKSFIRDFGLSDRNDLVPGLQGYELDENWIDDPSPLSRIWLLFRANEFVGAFHSRPLHLTGTRSISVSRGQYFTSFTKDAQLEQKMIKDFNDFMKGVD